MQAFTIKTSESDYPFLVIADGFKNAVEVLYQKGIYDTDIISVQNMESFVSDHIIIEEHLISKFETKASTEGRWWPEDIDARPVSEIISYMQRKYPHYGYGARVSRILEKNNIKTIGDLMRISRREFKKYNQVGMGSIKRIDWALEELYNIKGW